MRFLFFLPLLPLMISFTACSGLNPDSGQLNGSLSAGIVNGKNATEADVLPGALAESVVGIYTGNAICSGTLIAPEIVLTAAHCFEGVKQANDVVVFLHVINMLADQQPATAVGFHAAAYAIDSDYNHGSSSSSIDDLALIRLSKPVPTGTKIAQLPSETFDYGTLKQVMTFGYGNSDDRHNQALEVAGAGTLRYTSFDADHIEILPSGKAAKDQIDKSIQGMIGAAADTTAVCSGDSGGPLMQSEAGVPTNVVVGVNDAVIAHFEGQQEKDFEAAAVQKDGLKAFYKKYPDAHDCLGGINFFIPVTRRLMWIQTHMNRLMKGTEEAPTFIPDPDAVKEAPVPPPPPPAF